MNCRDWKFVFCMAFIAVPIFSGLYAEDEESGVLFNSYTIDSKSKDNTIPKPEISLLVDTYYAVTDNRYEDRTRPYVTQALETDQFSLNHALINFRGNGDDFRYALGIHTGTYVQANYAAEPEQMKYIYQGWGGVAIGSKLWLDVGVFPSHIGGESAISMENYNYTRSLIAENSPYYETGARLVWEVTDDLTTSLYALNGWQQIRSNNRDIAGGLQFEYKIFKNWLLNFSNYAGNEAPDSEKRQTRYFQDFFIRGKILPWLDTYLVYDVGFQKKKSPSWVETLEMKHTWASKTPKDSYLKWQGFSVQFYFHLTESWKIGIRGEGYYDPHQIIIQTETKNGYQLEAGTLNIDYYPAHNILFRMELKQNSAVDPIFRDQENHGFYRENMAVFNLSVRH